MMFRTLLALAALAAAVQARTRSHQLTAAYTFETYEAEFMRGYATPEERAMRKAVFAKRLAAILSHNADPNASYRRGVNQFTDRTDAELARRGYDKRTAYASRSAMKSAISAASAVDLKDLPSRVDWREKNVVSPVKNQGHCGSCWTFASTEALESAWAIKTGELQELSEQFILDCTPNPDKCGGTGGCLGGTAELAYNELVKAGGIPSEWTYPYISGMGAPGKCRGVPLIPAAPHQGNISAAATIKSHVSVETNSYSEVIKALATVGPMAVSVDAGAWHDYESGVFDGGNMTNPDLDHLVQLVGYGTEDGKDYWLVRNSWTPLWGDKGYIKLKRYGADGGSQCGIDVTPLDGNGCAGGPPTVKVCGQNGVLYDAVYPVV